jgi:ABC-type lipoprotein release transport system permease subunit
MVVLDGVRLAVYGVAIGGVGAWALASSLRSLLFDVSPSDPLIVAGTCAGALVVTTIASLVPAMRVMRVDPSIALRVE